MVESLLCRWCSTRKEKTMDFGQALNLLKAGKAVARVGWNGKGMFLLLIPGSTFQVAEGRPMAKHFPVGQEVQYHAHIDMKTAHGTVVPWLASQTDMLAEDWTEASTKQ
jgi:hypothetical protein